MSEHETYWRVRDAEQAKNQAYQERDRLVAALSKHYPASLERHQPEDDQWEDDWRWVVIIDLPTGQVSWHIHDSELPYFEHLPQRAGRQWDGHSTEEKYFRLALLPNIPDLVAKQEDQLNRILQPGERLLELRAGYKKAREEYRLNEWLEQNADVMDLNQARLLEAIRDTLKEMVKK